MSALFLPPLRAASSWSWLTLGVVSFAFWGSVLLLPASPAQQADEIDVFATLIAPILEDRCISCHDADEPEVGLRMDSYEELMFGSELGPVVVAKRPEASALIQVLHLPVEHERHMPPKRKPQPSEEEIAVLTWWIRAGAPKNADLSRRLLPEAVRARLDSDPLRVKPELDQDSAAETEASDPAHAVAIEALDPAEVDFAREIQPLFSRYCFECHDARKQKGDVRLDTIDPDIVSGQDAETWNHVLDMINGGEMPPRKADQPSNEERRLLVAWLMGGLERAIDKRRGELQTVVRRLNKPQYTRTLQELLGLGVDFGRSLPNDAKSEMGFTNNGEVLQASQLHLETYQEIARTALNKAIVLGDRPEVKRYKVNFGKGRGMGSLAGETGGYQAVILPKQDFLLEILDSQGQPILPTDDQERDYWDQVRRKISVGLRGSSGSRFRVVDEGMILYGALPHREVAPGSWQGPSPNLKMELQRVFPDEGDFVMRVGASRAKVFRSKERVLIALENPVPLAFEREGIVIPPAKSHVFLADKAKDRKNLRSAGLALLPVEVPANSSASFELEVAQDGYFQIDVVHPPAPIDAMPSVRIGIQKLTLDTRLHLSGAELDAERVITAMGATFLPAGKHKLTIGGRFFVGFEQLIVTAIPEGHPAVAPLQAASLAREAELQKKVPSLRAFVGTRTDDGMDYANFGEPLEVRAPVGSPEVYSFYGRLEDLPLPAPESGDTEILSGFSLFGVWNDHLVKSSADPGPPLLVESIEIEAPYFEQWPPASHTQIFFDSPNQTNELVYAEEVIGGFMQRAFRRPIEPDELDRYVGFWDSMRADFGSFEESIRETLIAVLCSPHFLFLAEPESTQHALATRLSYFLWNAPPDAELLQLAVSDELSDELAQETDRLLDDVRSESFVRAFTHEWLRMDRQELMTIDAGRFPAYTRFVKRDMAEETYRFMQYVIDEDLPIATLIDSDFAMLNQNLAEFYGIPGVEGNHFRPVPLAPELGRGGLLSQGAFLAGHSDGRFPHTVKRAVWLKAKILGDEPPPPPPNVPLLDPETPGFENLTLKQQLEKHRDNPSCHDCHAGIDPFGVAFEHYNAVGLLEDQRAGQAIDASTVLPDGTHVDGLAELKRYILEQERQAFLRSLVDHLFAYALGRDLSFADEVEISQIVAYAERHGETMRAVLRGIVLSPSFTSR
jgi:mono/diheme cytochrome c family protein